MNRIILGLPKGSLNTIGRGNTYQVLTDAGYDVQGYEPGNESGGRLMIANDPEIVAMLTRPQSAPVELSRSLLDIAIVGDDWVEEERIPNSSSEVRRIGDLEYGNVRLVFAVPKQPPYESLTDFFLMQRDRKEPILCFTEYINTARRGIMEDPGYREIFGEIRPLIQIRGLVEGENELVQIINSDGTTEEYIRKGADIIVDNTQTGRSLKEAGLMELKEIMKSSTGLYAGPGCVGWKEEKANLIYKQILGAVVGDKKFDIKFNVPNNMVDEVVEYMISNGLCSDEPTVSRKGRKKTSINVVIDKDKYPKISGKMQKRYNVTKIVKNTIEQLIE